MLPSECVYRRRTRVGRNATVAGSRRRGVLSDGRPSAGRSLADGRPSLVVRCRRPAVVDRGARDQHSCCRRKKVYFVVMMWARYLNNNYCDYNLILAFNTYTYFLEYNVIVI